MQEESGLSHHLWYRASKQCKQCKVLEICDLLLWKRADLSCLLSVKYIALFVRELFPILYLKIGRKLNILYRYEGSTSTYLCFEVGSVCVCVCVLVSFSSFLFLEDTKRLAFTSTKHKLELFNHLFYYTKISLVVIDSWIARMPPHDKFTWILWSFSTTVYFESKFT